MDLSQVKCLSVVERHAEDGDMIADSNMAHKDYHHGRAHGVHLDPLATMLEINHNFVPVRKLSKNMSQLMWQS